jgi:hypothetical protein
MIDLRTALSRIDEILWPAALAASWHVTDTGEWMGLHDRDGGRPMTRGGR